ncbi:DUF2933 domain-containing protein [Methylorubrum populi]|uniref:DUF2933 domain-containing protein n=1 Tax=Methylorubrum rhodesianum TaxID=29427 RepID=A0ABU9Z4P6_9HYPH|nr:DUF2933 domain-containing protein [Methylorubrum rhodesianum]MBK3404073.1 DUF2933 domain-containing protein [Methylorubrum rhodesianum]MBY0143386.1 DUF2933 domain-containing protein [Methylorubrum populi]
MSGSRGQPARTNGSRRALPIGLIAFLLIAGLYLLTEHQAHAFGFLPWLLLLACPLLHLVMHGGHGRKDEVASDQAPPSSPRHQMPSD